MVMHRRSLLLLVALTLPWVGCAVGAERAGSPSTRTLTILTYNVLASNDRDAQRIPALFAIFEASEADVICLQEVLPAFLARLEAQPWFRDRYHAPQDRGRAAIANGNYICSRHAVDRVEVIDHHSPQGRQSLVVHLRVEGRSLAIATCHLESLLEDGSIRSKQLDDVFSRLGSAGEAIFAGDLNFGDGEQPETAHLDPGYSDLWSSLRPGQPGFTWNIDTNDMAARGSFVGEGSRRLDRVLVRSKRWRPHSVRILGDQPIDTEGLLFPSDHFGLLAVLRAAR
jgi:endonuclease/exonuclease/phosphatase family metal-dependent hydrolase